MYPIIENLLVIQLQYIYLSVMYSIHTLIGFYGCKLGHESSQVSAAGKEEVQVRWIHVCIAYFYNS